MSVPNTVTVQQFDKSTFRQVKVVSGISPNALRRVFGVWILFALVVGVVVSLAPDISLQFELMTYGVLTVFTIAMFWQSRIAEGWPSILLSHSEICVVCDPQRRSFICVPVHMVKDAKPTLIKPNKKAVEIMLNAGMLSEEDREVLNQAVWPRDDRLLALANFKSRESVCEEISQFLKSRS